MKAIVTVLEKLGGARPLDARSLPTSVALGLWWLGLLLTVLAFAGRYSKFVYVDF